MDEQLERYVERTVGRFLVVTDRSWGHGESRVLEVRDVDGVGWFVKQHRLTARYRAEVAAYRRWVPVLGDRAPRLRDCDADLQVLVLSAVPGEAALDGPGVDPKIHRQACVLLRLFHGADVPVPWAGFAAEKLEAFERWAFRAEGLLQCRQLSFARAQVQTLAEIPPPVRVPCHLDYSPRNWLVADGQVRVIDFGEAALDVWVSDLARLWFGSWSGRPDLKEAFLEGYGRAMTGDDLTILLACGALGAVRTVVWAREHGDAPFEQAARRNLSRMMDRLS